MLALAVALVLPASAQTPQTFNVTVKQIFAVSPGLHCQGADAPGHTARSPAATFQRLFLSSTPTVPPTGGTSDTLVRFTGVLLSDPLSSGLASTPAPTAPDRVHVFVRDVAAATDPAGLRGYVIQVVDGNYSGDGLQQLAPGAVVHIHRLTSGISTGAVQLSPTSIEMISQNYPASYPDALRQPICGDRRGPQQARPLADPAANNPQATLNFANFPNNSAEYVRLTNLQVEPNARLPAALQRDFLEPRTARCSSTRTTSRSATATTATRTRATSATLQRAHDALRAARRRARA